MLKLTKKGDKYWLFEDSEIGLFSPSKFTINLLNNDITIVYENGLKSKTYNVIDCEIYDLGSLVPFTTSSGDEFMAKLEELNCPCFQKKENIYTGLENFKVIAQNFTDSSAVTGTTAITTIQTVVIPANTFEVGDTIVLKARIIKTGVNGVVSHRHSIDGFEFFSQSSSPTSLYHQIEREIFIKSSTITEEISGSSVANSSNGGYLENQRRNIDWTLPQTLTIGLNNNHASDSSIVSAWQLIRIRQ